MFRRAIVAVLCKLSSFQGNSMTPQPRHDSTSESQIIAAHSADAIRQRLAEGTSHSYLKDFVYGAIDGTVTTFAVVSGVAGAELSPNIVLILGTANLVGDGFSMAAGNYLGTRAERQQRERLRRVEERHIDLVPAGEREEIRQIFEAQGFAGQDLQRAVDVITSDRERWVQTMLKEEYGLAGTGPSAIRAATTTFVAFLVVGALPLLPFAANPAATVTAPFAWSTGLTGVAFFLTGAIKSRFVDESWALAGVTTLFVGTSAAGLAYIIGALLAQLIR